jgi:hypothetical protein
MSENTHQQGRLRRCSAGALWILLSMASACGLLPYNRDYLAAQEAGTAEAYREYLRNYPDSPLAPQAKVELTRLASKQANAQRKATSVEPETTRKARIEHRSRDLACTTVLKILLETFGEGVLVELRAGVPGKSKVADTRRSSGGTVVFSGLCAGTYFLAIGNDEDVSVTPTRTFYDEMTYTSKITVTFGHGNVGRKKRSIL